MPASSSGVRPRLRIAAISAAGSAIGGNIGGPIGATIGARLGSAVGQRIDNSVFGAGKLKHLPVREFALKDVAAAHEAVEKGNNGVRMIVLPD